MMTQPIPRLEVLMSGRVHVTLAQTLSCNVHILLRGSHFSDILVKILGFSSRDLSTPPSLP